jgi:hypothetical protein
MTCASQVHSSGHCSALAIISSQTSVLERRWGVLTGSHEKAVCTAEGCELAPTPAESGAEHHASMQAHNQSSRRATLLANIRE